MSKIEVDKDGFRIVKSKRFSKNKLTKIPPKDIQFEKEDINIDIDKALRQIYSATEELRASNYLKNVVKAVSTILQTKNVKEIVCFGLGHIGECNISKYQLALLLCLRDLCHPNKVLVHDPIFYHSECEVLKQLNIHLIEENNEGSYVISDNDISLIFLPHCPKQLTNNFLWSNWGVKLHYCLLICNSFTSLIENQLSRVLAESVPYIHQIYPYTNEIVLDNNFKFTDIFNDTSLHTFPKENLEKLKPEFWTKGDKPSYENSEEFITSLMIEKLNI